MKYGITAVIVSLALFVPAALGATTVSVKATEFHFALSKTSVAHGKVTFKIKPRKKGRLTFKATKPGYTAGSLTMRVT